MRNDKIIKEIKMRLGAPTVLVELTDEQIQEAIRTAKEEFKFITSSVIVTPRPGTQNIWIKRYALAICKEMLGRVREKIDYLSTPMGNKIELDAKALLKESADEKNLLFRMCINQTPEHFILLDKNKI